MSVNRLRNELHPVFKLAAVFGVQMFEYRVVSLNYIQYALTWLIYTGTFGTLWMRADFRTIFGSYIYRFVIFANALTSLIATALTLQHKKKFQRILEDLTSINDTFEILDIPEKFGTLQQKVWKIIGIWIIMGLYSVIGDASWMFFIFGWPVGSLVVLVTDYPFLINAITYVLICLMLSYTETKFIQLNERIEKLTVKKAANVSWSFGQENRVTYGQVNPVNVEKRDQEIWTLMHIHGELNRICRHLNTIFGVQITLEIASYFVFMAGLAIYLLDIQEFKPLIASNPYLTILLKLRVSTAIMWAFVYIGRLIHFNHRCDSVSAQAYRTTNIMHDFLNSAKDPELQSEARQFFLHMINRPLKFNGMGMFHFGYEFVHMFFGAIATVVVIVMQNKTPGHHSDNSITIVIKYVNSTIEDSFLTNIMLHNSSSIKS